MPGGEREANLTTPQAHAVDLDQAGIRWRQSKAHRGYRALPVNQPHE